MASYFDHGLAEKAMLEGLNWRIKDALKVRFEEVAKETVDEAVEQACKTFEVDLNSFREQYNMRDVVQVILKKESK